MLKEEMLGNLNWPKSGLGGEYSKMTTGYPVIMVVISVVMVKKTAAYIPV